MSDTDYINWGQPVEGLGSEAAEWYPGAVSYARAPLGADPEPTSPKLPGGIESNGEDVSSSIAIEALRRQRGFVAVPTRDVLDYVKAQVLTAGIGFLLGMGVGALLGRTLKKQTLKKATRFVAPNRRRARRNSRRRTSRRRRTRGRPSGAPVNESLSVKMPDDTIFVDVRRGGVYVGQYRFGSVYDMGTEFRAVPLSGEVRSYTTLAGAVKHVLRQAEAA